MIYRTAILAFAVCAAPLAGQRTWIVDADARPGADFTDLPPAVAAASAGDTIVVRGSPRTYRGAVITKRLAILGRNAPIISNLTISGLRAPDTVAVANFQLPGLRIEHNRGVVLVQDAIVQNSVIRDSAIVSMRQVIVLVATRWEVAASRIVLVDAWVSSFSFATVVRSRDSHWTIVDSNISVGGSFDPGPSCRTPPVAVAFDSSNDRFDVVGSWIAGGRASHGAGCRFAYPGIQGDGTTTVYRDPSAVIEVIAGATVIDRTVPAINADGASPGRDTTVEVTGASGAMAFLFVSLPLAAPLQLPLPGAPLWLDPTLLLAVGSGPIGASGRRSFAIPFSTVFAPGTALAFQAVTLLGPQAEVSQPGYAALH